MKCSAALSVLALAIAVTAAPMEENHYGNGNGHVNRGYEVQGSQYHKRELQGQDGDSGISKRGVENKAYEQGYRKQYKRAVQGKQTGYGQNYGAPYNAGDYEPSRNFNGNLNGNSRDNIGNNRDVVGNKGDTCSARGKQQVCCNGGLGCLVQLLGDHCSTSAYCCDTSSGPGTAVNLNLLNCLKLH
ncbi:hypothetical protein XA68_14826 [Ophiocordyceps unilateralis]|uniref:Hydrophobin n=1 Tax=Ophiocordyceps unilateralis TaxID=268505 RepID=A0A2A9PMN4_OPHUN|nr:hypothetical protein XA68_14826 [Ophiocordyceps unilateralis]